MKCSSAILAMAAAMLAAAPLYADVIVYADPVTAPAGSSGGYFDVVLTNTGPADLLFGAFFFGLSVSDPNITFTGATTGTASPYIFLGRSMHGSDIATTFGAQELVAWDLDNLITGVTVAPGVTVGLGRVFFNVGVGSASSVPVAFLSSDYTNLSDPAGNLIPINTLTDGVIDVTPASVPEPATFLPAGLAALALLATRMRRR